MKKLNLNPLRYLSLLGYSFDCWLDVLSGVVLDSKQDKQMVADLLKEREVASVVLWLIDMIIVMTKQKY